MSENLPAVVTKTAEVVRPDLLRNLAEIERVATACARSGYYNDVKDASQAVVKMLAGREMGIGPIQAIAAIHIVEGKPTAGANLIAANVKRSGRYDYRIKDRTEERCVLEWYEYGQKVGESAFSMEDAKRAGLANKHNWKSYPRPMLFARALTEGVRVYAPDAAAGTIYTPEELNPDLEVSEDGELVAPPAPEPKAPVPSVSPGVRVKESGVRVKEYMELRCEEFGVEPRDYANGALNSILRQLKIEKNAKAIAEREADIRAAIDVWKPPADEDSREFADGPAGQEAERKQSVEAEPGTFGAEPKRMRAIHAYVAELGYKGEEGHRMLHNALPHGVKSLSELPVTAEGDFRARVRELCESATKPTIEEGAF